MNELSERQIKILKVIIRTYMETGEPVGSRTISKASDLNLSSATIRNEMSDLEEMGYILQPHTSAGRIPSDKGYRFYVDHLMMEKDQLNDEINKHKEEIVRLDSMLMLISEYERKILIDVYVKGKNIGNIALELSRSRSKIKRDIDKSIKKIC